MKPNGEVVRTTADCATPRRIHSGWSARIALALLAPRSFRDEFLGDLLEELRTSRRLRDLSPGAARIWIWRQILASAPALCRSRLTRGGNLAKVRWIASGLFVAIASVQAWDSHVLAAPGFVIALVACGIAFHALGLLLASRAQTTIATMLEMAVLLVAAKIASPTELPALGVIGPMGLMTSFLRIAAERRAAQAGPPGASTVG